MPEAGLVSREGAERDVGSFQLGGGPVDRESGPVIGEGSDPQHPVRVYLRARSRE
jgi:hypothetical protein